MDETSYLVLTDRNGEVAAINVADADEAVADIASGQIEHATNVVRIDVWTGVTTDISKEIARRVLGEHLDGYGAPQKWAIGFLEAALGCQAVAVATREHAA